MPTDFAKLILEELPEAVIVTRPGGEIVCWTRRAQAMFGYAQADALGRRLDQLVLAPGQEDDGAAIEQHILEHGHARYEALWRHRDGTPQPVECAARSITADGRTLLLCTVRCQRDRQRLCFALQRTVHSSKVRPSAVMDLAAHSTGCGVPSRCRHSAS